MESDPTGQVPPHGVGPVNQGRGTGADESPSPQDVGPCVKRRKIDASEMTSGGGDGETHPEHPGPGEMLPSDVEHGPSAADLGSSQDAGRLSESVAGVSTESEPLTDGSKELFSSEEMPDPTHGSQSVCKSGEELSPAGDATGQTEGGIETQDSSTVCGETSVRTGIGGDRTKGEVADISGAGCADCMSLSRLSDLTNTCTACLISQTLDLQECVTMTLGDSSDMGEVLEKIQGVVPKDSDNQNEAVKGLANNESRGVKAAGMGAGNEGDEDPGDAMQKEGEGIREEVDVLVSDPIGSHSPGTGAEKSDVNDRTLKETLALGNVSEEQGHEGDHDVTMDDPEQAMWEAEQQQLPDIEYCFSTLPTRITGAWKEFKEREQNFLKGCKWSPDGTCILTNSNDNTMRLFNLPPQIWSREIDEVDELSSVLKMKEGDLIYDYCWYPRMSSMDPVSCCLVSSCRDNPIHMWDAFNGDLRCTYRAYDSADEIISAYSVAFSNSGEKLYCGFNGAVRIFDINRPGRDCQTRQNKDMVVVQVKEPNKKRKKKGKAKKAPRPTYQRGILSCIAISPDDSLYAVGSYAKTVSVYCAVSGEMICLLNGHIGGVTHLKFSPDGTYIYSGGRKDPEILCWDTRNPGKPLFSLRRRVDTHQRMYFDLDRSGRYLVSGNHDGTTSVWDLTATHDTDVILEPMLRFRTHNETTNGVSLHPYLPLLVTGSGQQHCSPSHLSEDSSESDPDEVDPQEDNSIQLWWLGAVGEAMEECH